MNHRLSTRLTSLALAAIVTGSVFAGIDRLALTEHASTLQMSQANAATVVAKAATPAPRT